MSTSTIVYVSPKKNVNPLLAAYLARLVAKPLQTKMITAGVLSFLQEVLANHIAGVPVPTPRHVSVHEKVLAAAKINSRAAKMGIYGAFISAPMNHVLVGKLQKLFAGKTSTRARLLQLLVGNVFIAPIQAAVYLASMTIISGATSLDAIEATVARGMLPMLKILWVTSPTATLFAQALLPSELWVPFFNIVSLSVGTFFSVKIKKMQMAAARKKRPETKDEKELKDL